MQYREIFCPSKWTEGFTSARRLEHERSWALQMVNPKVLRAFVSGARAPVIAAVDGQNVLRALVRVATSARGQ